MPSDKPPTVKLKRGAPCWNCGGRRGLAFDLGACYAAIWCAHCGKPLRLVRAEGRGRIEAKGALLPRRERRCT